MFYFDDFWGKKVLKSTLLDDVEHFFTTRDFILKSGELSEKIDLAEFNKDFLCEKFNIDKSKLITANQIHSDNIEIVIGNQNFYDDCDGLVSNITDSTLLMNFADCVPIILYASDELVVSVVHAGWRGTSKEIVKNAVLTMVENFSVDPKNIKVAIGPAIGKCHFSVNKDVFEQLTSSNKELYECAYSYNKAEDKYYIDLKELNRLQLLDIGVSQIDVCGYCTCCMSDIFFSYRKEAGKTARHSAIIKLGKGR